MNGGRVTVVRMGDAAEVLVDSSSRVLLVLDVLEDVLSLPGDDEVPARSSNVLISTLPDLLA